MATINFSEFSKFNQGEGGSFFTLKSGESASVRILYDSYDDIIGETVHQVRNENGGFASVICPRDDKDAIDMCDYCKEGQKPVLRAIIPIYNEDSKKIEYWPRSGTFIDGTLRMTLDLIVNQGKSIASQPYIIRREGNGLETKYVVLPNGVPDDKNKNSFGEVKDPIKDLKMFKEPNYKIPEVTDKKDVPQATRRTANMFV